MESARTVSIAGFAIYDVDALLAMGENNRNGIWLSNSDSLMLE